ncbi:sarcosine oxidase subunit gamma [Alloyangia pacifica]|uniref:Sarcosine oxidase subunit gamma n=1 Tax=Alloyangia pacifica TaxID=311180 RepID=A0A1I6PPW7_9RHOB|nr:sarcosine oxidase subunit gamma family protein [Alloyangia pacifica]SDG32950.1 sarcosine oxidase subunit gamma [Alloyangia pacifica]SFS42247.1 sarcosine oxidase subunit gamma [Alloyangia pacifica]
MSETIQEPVSPLMGAVAEGALTVRELGPTGMISLRGELSDPAFAGPVTALAGCPMPDTWTVSGTGARALLWMSPDELLMLLPYGEAREAAPRLQAELDGQGLHALVQDVSDMRVRLQLQGPHMREALARLSPADVSPGAFRPGSLRRTRIAQAAAAIRLVSEEEAEVFCFRSVADYAFRLLGGAARNAPDFGYF